MYNICITVVDHWKIMLKPPLFAEAVGVFKCWTTVTLLNHNSFIFNNIRNQTTWLPYIIFGVLGILQVITVFWIPETLGVPMLTTLEEAEEFYKNGYSKYSENDDQNSEKTISSDL